VLQFSQSETVNQSEKIVENSGKITKFPKRCI